MKKPFWLWRKTYIPAERSSERSACSGAAEIVVMCMQARKHLQNARPASDLPVISNCFVKTGKLNSDEVASHNSVVHAVIISRRAPPGEF